MGDSTKGMLIGVVLGGLGGLGLCLWVIPTTWLFPGDTMLAGAIFWGAVGLFWGDDFIEWFKEHWRRFM
jgi:hypothetical protein